MAQQVIWNALVASARCFLIATGLLVIFRTVRFLDLAYGALFTVCAYTTLALRAQCGVPFLLSVLLAVLATVLLAGFLQYCIYAPLRRRAASSQVCLLASLGLYLVIVNVICLIWGDRTRALDCALDTTIGWLGARATSGQVLTVAAGLISWIALHLLLRRTELGRAMRALGSDPELARISGIDSEVVIMGAYGVGAVFVGLGAISVTVDMNITPQMGMSALLMGVVALIIGGAEHVHGVALAAMLLAGTQHFVAYKIGVHWQDPVAFLLLVGFLVVRPEGILGTRGKKASA